MDAVESILQFDNDSLRKYLHEGGDADLVVEGQNLLLWACSVSNSEAAIALIDHGASYAARTQVNETPLMLASYSGMQEAVARLLSIPADVGATDDAGRDALMLAAKGGNAEIVRVLCREGSSVLRKDHVGRTCLHWALVEGDNSDVVHELLANGAKVDTDLDSKYPSAVEYARTLQRPQSLAQLLRSVGG
jgi:ankyrin repeat protein